MKLGPLLYCKKNEENSNSASEYFQGVRARGAALESGRGWVGWGERCLMGRKEVKEAGWDEARTTSLW